VSYRHPEKRLVLKSPTHSCRIPTLLELFPDAQFIHIVRDPLVVYPSTVHLWKSLYRAHGLQLPTFRGLEEQVLDTFCHLYDRLEEGKKLVPAGHWHELRYEDLTARPLEEMRRLYESLHLGDFGRALPAIERYLADRAGYRTNKYPPLPEETVALLRRRWAKVIERYGYGKTS
jgi:hypothetical protein